MVERIVRSWTARAVKIVVMVILATALFGFIVMSLWNWLMPALFGWPRLGFWQALGLLVLSKILFGGFRGGRGHGRWRRGMRERWEQMTPEQREQMRERLSACCGHFPPAAEPKTERS